MSPFGMKICSQIFVCGHYLFQEVNSFPRAKLGENCELRGIDNVQGQISKQVFKAKWRQQGSKLTLANLSVPRGEQFSQSEAWGKL